MKEHIKEGGYKMQRYELDQTLPPGKQHSSREVLFFQIRVPSLQVVNCTARRRTLSNVIAL